MHPVREEGAPPAQLVDLMDPAAPPAAAPGDRPAASWQLRDGARHRPRRPRFVLDMLLGATLMVLVHLFVVQISVVKGHSMEPSLLDGDRLVVDRVSYAMSDVQRGDLIVLRYPRDPRMDFVKRVVGLPGDSVALHDGQLYVNGRRVSCNWDWIADHEEMQQKCVPDGHYFVLGDNRPISCDSRDFGLVASELIKGRVRARFWPLDRLAVF